MCTTVLVIKFRGSEIIHDYYIVNVETCALI